jgi:hypothetical protein
MDKLDQIISEKQTEISEVDKQINSLAARHERLLIELQALKHAASLRPVTPENKPGAETVARSSDSRTGRQKGDISLPWRRVLQEVWRLHRRVSYGEVQLMAEKHGLQTKLANVRERMRSMVDAKLITGDAKIGFLVTKHAVERFGFADKDKAPPDESGSASRFTGEVPASSDMD